MIENLLQLVNYCDLGKRAILDIASVIEGERPLCLLHIPKYNEKKVKEGIASIFLEIKHERSLLKYRDKFSRESILRSKTTVAKDDEEEWVELWISKPGIISNNLPNLEQSTGKALSYPGCCCIKYEGQISLANHYQEYMFSLNSRSWKINRLATIFSEAMFLPDYFPCSLSCKNSIKIAERFIRLSSIYFDQKTINSWIHDLMAPLTVWDDQLIWWKSWKVINETLIVDLSSARSKKLVDIASITKPVLINFSSPWLIPFEHLSFIRRFEIVKESITILSLELENIRSID
jgi:hypothetical protein